MQPTKGIRQATHIPVAGILRHSTGTVSGVGILQVSYKGRCWRFSLQRSATCLRWGICDYPDLIAEQCMHVSKHYINVKIDNLKNNMKKRASEIAQGVKGFTGKPVDSQLRDLVSWLPHSGCGIRACTCSHTLNKNVLVTLKGKGKGRHYLIWYPYDFFF